MKKFLSLGVALFALTVVGCTQPPATTTTTTTTTTTAPSAASTASPAAAASASPAAGSSESPAAASSGSPAAASSESPAAEKKVAEAPKPDKVLENGDELYSDDDADLQFTVPKGWTTATGDYGWTISSADKAISIVLLVPDEGDFDKAVASTSTELDKMMTNVKVAGEAKPSEQNGMKVESLSGEGDIKGTHVKWAMDMVKAKVPVIFVTIAQPAALDKNMGQATTFFNSIKRQE